MTKSYLLGMIVEGKSTLPLALSLLLIVIVTLDSCADVLMNISDSRCYDSFDLGFLKTLTLSGRLWRQLCAVHSHFVK
jgi:hypothetical protein